MEDINAIYHNSFGFAFQWKQTETNGIGKVQLVFRDTGLLLSLQELKRFQKNIEIAMNGNSLCNDCKNSESCRALLVDTPAPQVTLAMNTKELAAVHDLVTGTLFQLNLDDYLNRICNN